MVRAMSEVAQSWAGEEWVEAQREAAAPNVSRREFNRLRRQLTILKILVVVPYVIVILLVLFALATDGSIRLEYTPPGH
jgi:hypothetical protein